MSTENRYGRLDRLLHRIAFRVGTAQEALADVEETLFRDTLEDVPLENPVFISALPRCGTTILLNLLWDTGHFASHTYRDMPFVMCPMLWSRFSRRFAAGDEPRERYHGDGIEVSGGSPEAFEEMIWKHFWPSHYRSDRIVPWTSAERKPEFDRFLATHMRKVIALRRGESRGGNGARSRGASARHSRGENARESGSESRGDGAPEIRYLSKNNVNIARLVDSDPPGPLGRGVFLVPFREPFQHAASMLRQHRRFLEIHRRDDFVRRYMEAIGHHEFGQGLLPVDFGGWLDRAPSADGLEFWIRYWSAAYRHVLEHLDARTVLVSYASLVGEPERSLTAIAERVQVPRADLVGMARRLRQPRSHEIEMGGVPDAVREEASHVFSRLRERADV